MPTSLILRQWTFSDLLVTTYSNGPGYSDFVEDWHEHTDNHRAHFAQGAFFQASLCPWMPIPEMPPQMTWQGWAMSVGIPGWCSWTGQHPIGAQGPSEKCRLCHPFSCSLPWPWCWALAGHRLRAVGSLPEKVPSRAYQCYGRGACQRTWTGKYHTQHAELADLCPWPNHTGTKANGKPPSASSECDGCPRCPIHRAKSVHHGVGNAWHFHH